MSSEEQRREEGQEPEERTEEEAAPVEPSGAPEDPETTVEETEEEALPPDGTQPDDVDVAFEAEVVSDDEVDALEVEDLREELEATRLERDRYREDMMYLRAEFDNVRKRQERELERTVRSASEGLVRELLPVMDNLERALEVDGDVREGVQATLEQFANVLGAEGLSPMVSDGEHFDPNIHEAVMSQPSEEHEENVVLQTFQRGYTLNGKPIRTAKVVVAR